MMRKYSKLVFTATLFAGLLAIALTSPTQAGSDAIYENPIEPPTTPALETGKQSYEQFCSECHGPTASGSDKGPTFINRVYHPGHHGD